MKGQNTFVKTKKTTLSSSYDENAVKIYRTTGEQLGFLSSGVAREAAPRFDKGSKVDAEISDLAGGGLTFKTTHGRNIKITKYRL